MKRWIVLLACLAAPALAQASLSPADEAAGKREGAHRYANEDVWKLFSRSTEVPKMEPANDRGIECLLLEDCTGATDFNNYLSALKMVKMQGGVFGTVAPSHHLFEALAVMTR